MTPASKVQVDLLGPLVVRIAGQPVKVGRGKGREILALLALSPGRPVAVERLVDDLWGEELPDTAVQTLQVHVSNVRRWLGDPSLLTLEPAGYVLSLAPTDVDAVRFGEAMTTAAELSAAAAPDRALAALETGLASWRGPALVDVRGSDALSRAAAALDERYLDAVEARHDLLLRTGRHLDVLASVAEHISSAPYRERLRAQQMLALYRAGRQAEALAAFAGARETLLDELGVDPGPELRDLEARILRQDESLAAPQPHVATSDATAESFLRRTVTVVAVQVGDPAQDDVEVLEHRRLLVRPIAAAVAAATGGALDDGPSGLLLWYGADVVQPDDARQAVAAALLVTARCRDEIGVVVSTGVAGGVALVRGGRVRAGAEAVARALAGTAPASDGVRTDALTRRAAGPAVFSADDPAVVTALTERPSSSSIIGRDPLVEEVVTRLRTAGARSLVLHGAAGIGKTRVLERAAELADVPLVRVLPAGGADATEVMRLLDRGGSGLAVDDVHWADAATLALLRSAVESGLRVVATARPGSPDLLPAADRHDVQPLADDVAGLLARQLRPDLSDGDADRLVRTADGNPLLIHELAATDVISAEATLESHLGARLATMPPVERAVLQVCALALPAASSDLLALLPDEVASDVDRAISQLARDRILIRQKELVEFAHPAWRDVAGSATPLVERRRLHAALAARWSAGGSITELARAATHLRQLGLLAERLDDDEGVGETAYELAVVTVQAARGAAHILPAHALAAMLASGLRPLADRCADDLAAVVPEVVREAERRASGGRLRAGLSGGGATGVPPVRLPAPSETVAGELTALVREVDDSDARLVIAVLSGQPAARPK